MNQTLFDLAYALNEGRAGYDGSGGSAIAAQFIRLTAGRDARWRQAENSQATRSQPGRRGFRSRRRSDRLRA